MVHTIYLFGAAAALAAPVTGTQQSWKPEINMSMCSIIMVVGQFQSHPECGNNDYMVIIDEMDVVHTVVGD